MNPIVEKYGNRIVIHHIDENTRPLLLAWFRQHCPGNDRLFTILQKPAKRIYFDFVSKTGSGSDRVSEYPSENIRSKQAKIASIQDILTMSFEKITEKPQSEDLIIQYPQKINYKINL